MILAWASPFNSLPNKLIFLPPNHGRIYKVPNELLYKG